MKYIKITGSMVVGTDNLTREDLVRMKQRAYDAIINRIELTYYDAEENDWKPIIDIDV